MLKPIPAIFLYCIIKFGLGRIPTPAMPPKRRRPQFSYTNITFSVNLVFVTIHSIFAIINFHINPPIYIESGNLFVEANKNIRQCCPAFIKIPIEYRQYQNRLLLNFDYICFLICLLYSSHKIDRQLYPL